MSLEGQVAIVTGGGRGIGRGISLCLAEDGTNVVVLDVNLADAEQVASEVAARGREALALQTNVASVSEVEAAVKAVLERFGRIDILVNNAGVIGAPGWRECASSRLADWDACYEVNLKAAVICSEAVAGHMKERQRGRIVNIASIAARRGGASSPHYNASKAACLSYTQSLAHIMAPYNVTVNAICPGLLWTAMWGEIAERQRHHDPGLTALGARDVFLQNVERGIPLGREQTPEDIGYAVCFFASERARNITGQGLNVDGGRIMN